MVPAVSVRPLGASIAFAKLSPIERFKLFLDTHPKEGAALVGMMDEVWAAKERQRKLRPPPPVV